MLVREESIEEREEERRMERAMKVVGLRSVERRGMLDETLYLPVVELGS